jgi:DNA-binding MarR family transcriptional regulator
MKYNAESTAEISNHQNRQFQQLVTRLFQCCQERMQYQSERFELPDAELRCLLLFAEERYLTPKGIAHKLNVVKSRVTRIIGGLLHRKLIHRIPDPEDSRISLLSLTPDGQKRIAEIRQFQESLHREILRQIAPEQRKTILTHLEMLRAAMEAVREMMA